MSGSLIRGVCKLVDVQNSKDKRGLEINKVGVKSVKIPLIIADKNREKQHIVAEVNMYVDLPIHFKGAHMSRFIEVLNEYKDNSINMYVLSDLLEHTRKVLDAKTAHIELVFPYFMEKESPVSKKKSLMNYDCKFVGVKSDTENSFLIEVKIPISTVCPCSKELCQKGAHNQRGIVTVKFKSKDFIWIEDIIKLVEEEASCEVYSLLKREDEKHVTEKAYDNPKFVEDVTRDVSLKLKQDKRIEWFSVETENFESIHNHNAYAFIES